jgi:hypothetical protein
MELINPLLKGGRKMGELVDSMETLIADQMKKLHSLRERLEAASDSTIFTKKDYLELLDAYIDCEERLHGVMHLLREAEGV